VSKPSKTRAGLGPAGEQESRELDAEAVRRTLAGETAAYDSLIERYQRRAVAVAYRLLGNIEDAMDVCQEAFLRAYRSLESLEEPASFGAWLMRIVSNLSLNFRRGRRPHLSLSRGDEDDGGNADSLAPDGQMREMDGADTLGAAETQRAVTKAVDSLPPQQKLALVLFAIEGLPQKTVAEIMECSVEMVKWNVFQARKALKLLLADHLES